jgi:hypothetical protein
MDPVDIYKTDLGDVVVREGRVLNTTVKPESTKHYLEGDSQIDWKTIDGKTVLKLPAIPTSDLAPPPPGFSKQKFDRTIPVKVADERTGVPYADYESALESARALQETYDTAEKEIRAGHGLKLAALMEELKPDLLEPSKAYREQRDALAAELEKEIAAIKPVPSLIDLLPTSDS